LRLVTRVLGLDLTDTVPNLGGDRAVVWEADWAARSESGKLSGATTCRLCSPPYKFWTVSCAPDGRFINSGPIGLSMWCGLLRIDVTRTENRTKADSGFAPTPKRRSFPRLVLNVRCAGEASLTHIFRAGDYDPDCPAERFSALAARSRPPGWGISSWRAFSY